KPSISSALGGGIGNFRNARLEVDQCTLRGNEAIGGNNATQVDPNVATVGTADGGAIVNIYGGEVVVRNSTIEHNRALAAHRNTGSGPGSLVGTAAGGGIDNLFDGSG